LRKIKKWANRPRGDRERVVRLLMVVLEKQSRRDFGHLDRKTG